MFTDSVLKIHRSIAIQEMDLETHTAALLNSNINEHFANQITLVALYKLTKLSHMVLQTDRD